MFTYNTQHKNVTQHTTITHSAVGYAEHTIHVSNILSYRRKEHAGARAVTTTNNSASAERLCGACTLRRLHWHSIAIFALQNKLFKTFSVMHLVPSCSVFYL